jgi:hypothetical protein
MGREEGRPDSGEAVVSRTRLHWVMIAGPAALMVIAGLSIGHKGTSAFLVLAFAVMWGVFSSISFELSEIVLTKEGLLVKIGFPWRRSYDFPLAGVADVIVYQPSLGKVLDFGKITIKRTNGKRTSFRMVRSPHLLAQAIYECKRDGTAGPG